MKKFSLKHLFKLLSVCMVCAAVWSCSDDDNSLSAPVEGVSNVYMASSIGVKGRAPIVVSGNGFVDTDVVTLTSSEGVEYTATTVGVTENSLQLQVPVDIPNGTYVGRLTRANGVVIMLGNIKLYWVVDTDLPDVDGMTVKGTVSCDGKGLKGVVVSDGYEVTTTDEYGCYWLPSAKKNGYVFMSMPSGYFTDTQSGVPEFFKRLSYPDSEVEQCDFVVKEEPNDDYVVVLMADAHLANRGSGSNNDMNQFRNQFVADVNSTIAEYKAAGKKIYGITLGDLTWDSYWYDKNYKLPDVLKDFAKINVPIFHCMGNHDNDIRAITDFETAAAWRINVGPTYYSFNLGKTHYVVLDDIEYVTDGAENKTETAVITQEQMDWLRKDLATVTDKSTPLVVCMHIPLHSHPGRTESGELVKNRQIKNADEFIDALSGFSKVRLLTGHTHVNYNVPVDDNIIEHNIAGVCATWWWTGKYHGTHICRDGSIGGYGVMEWTGNDYNRYYKSMGYDRSYQFRTYDRNNVYITPEQYAPDQNHSDPAFITNFNYLAQDYAFKHNDNEIILNIFGWEDTWKLEITEDGKPLIWGVTSWFDPLHIISFDMFRLNKNNENLSGSAMRTSFTPHLFRTYASSPTSTIEIKVTDCYGNVYRETMTRPKAFTYTMK